MTLSKPNRTRSSSIDQKTMSQTQYHVEIRRCIPWVISTKFSNIVRSALCRSIPCSCSRFFRARASSTIGFTHFVMTSTCGRVWSPLISYSGKNVFKRQRREIVTWTSSNEYRNVPNCPSVAAPFEPSFALYGTGRGALSASGDVPSRKADAASSVKRAKRSWMSIGSREDADEARMSSVCSEYCWKMSKSEMRSLLRKGRMRARSFVGWSAGHSGQHADRGEAGNVPFAIVYRLCG